MGHNQHGERELVMLQKLRLSTIWQSFNEFCDVRLVAVGLGVIALAHCSAETQAGNSPLLGVYLQVDRVARPGVKEIFENFATHTTSNYNSPTSDTALPAAILNFMTNTGSSGAVVPPETTNSTTGASDAAKLDAIFVPDELQANLSSAVTSASYLSLELGNASQFGGRALTDAAMETDLSIIYGGTASVGLGVTANQCMITDGLSSANMSNPPSSKFPYVTTTSS
jgi:hypothetical protein